MARSPDPAPPPAREPAKPRPPLGLALVVLALVLAWAAIGAYLYDQRRRYEAEAYGDAVHLARGFAESISRTIEAMDQVFALLRAFHRANPDRFDIRTLAPSGQVLTDLTLQMAVTDNRGMMTASNLGGPPIDLSDREHIRVHLDQPGDFLFVSKPVLGRVSGKWSIQLTRKLFGPGGAMAGVLVISLDPAYFARFYQAFDIGQGTIALIGLDGIYRARAPGGEASLGAAAGAQTMQALRGPSETGAWRGRSDIDGVEQFYAYRRLEKYGLAVTVGLGVSDTFAPFERSALQFGFGGLALSVLVIVVGRLLVRQGSTLVRSERELTATLENMSQGIVMIDADDRLAVINQRAVQLLGLPDRLGRVGVSFRSLLSWQLDNDEFTPGTEGGTDVSALARGGGLGPSMYERARPDGTVLEVRTRELPGGGAVRTYTDITERKRTELALAAARDAAEAGARVRSEFMATMSHEIRTPLNAVIGMAGLLIDSDLPPHLQRFASTLRDAAETLLQTIDDILDFSKLDAERMELETIGFAVAPLAASVVDLMEVKAAEKGLYLRLDLAPGVPERLIGDPGRVRQVLLNLVANGLKFTEEGGVTITVSAEPRDGTWVMLDVAVTDTGIGIEPAAQSRLFEPFTQVDGSISRRYGGSGLGLVICRRLTERMGGEIGLVSALGSGSTFRFRLPMRIDFSRPAPVEAAALPAAPGRRLRILLAEDNATNRMVAITRLELMGHRVDAVADGGAAVRALQDSPYDLVLMDLMMPQVDGLTATRRIRALPSPQADIPIVAITANVFRSHQDACRAAGMDDFLGKPLMDQQLRRILALAIDGTLRHPGGAAADEPLPATIARLVGEMGEESAQEALHGFLHEAREQLEKMDAALQTQDWPGLGGAARALHEGAAMLEAGMVLRAAERLIDAPPDAAPARLKALDAALRGLEEGLAEARGQPLPRSQDSRLR